MLSRRGKRLPSGSGIFSKIPNFNTLFPSYKGLTDLIRLALICTYASPSSFHPVIPPQFFQNDRYTYFAQVLQKCLFNGVPLKALVSVHPFKFSSPVISNFVFSVMRFIATARNYARKVGGKGARGEIHEPAVFLQFVQRHVWPQRRVKSSESLTRTVIAS
jgi:hypothetical protein